MTIATEGHPFFTESKQITAWLKAVGIAIKSSKINVDGLVDVKGDVNLNDKLGELNRLPIRFGKVSGYFCCTFNKLASLKGAPKEVGGDFDCGYNQLVSLEGGPKKIGWSFSCCYNKLVSLEGAPKKVGRNFYCYGNQLVDFKGLEDVSIVGKLDVSAGKAGRDNVFVSLEGLPKALYGKVKGLDVKALQELEQAGMLDVVI